MHSNIIKRISPSIRLLIFLILSISIFICKSIYLMLFITTFIFILMVISEKKVKLYVNIVKKILIILLFILFIYIIILRKYYYLDIVIMAYKLLTVAILIIIYENNTTFKELHEGLFGILKIFGNKNNVEKISFDLARTFKFFDIMFIATDKVKNKQKKYFKRKQNIKNLVFSKLIYSINSLNKFENNLKINFYKLNYRKIDTKSKLILMIFLLFFVICIIKEVIV